MTVMYKIQTKHLNEHSTLYGGQLLEWIDNYCLAKTENYRVNNKEKFVTRSMHCDFIASAKLGDLIKISVAKIDIGNTSITFHFNVLEKKTTVAKGKTTFVKIINGKKAQINRSVQK